MGGYGSGRTSNKLKAEHFRKLDVNSLNRAGCLEDGKCGNWVWSRDGEEVARIGYRSEGHRLVLDYRFRQYGDDWESVTMFAGITYADCNYGSQRPYFRCPGVVNGRSCGRRVAKLFAGGKYFLCRHCYNIGYASQSEPRYDRMLRRANKLRQALGGEPGTAHWIAPKPKGMHQRTYQSKRCEIEWCESQADELFIAKFQHLLRSGELRVNFD